ncbi:PREDICTED: uncharacterized protein LOC105451676 [Wasmannia auropunctata]|uniref:uncharacterized protein LOC105451676 n=1 Tax=Wasmannia auropunctata TaxID=64793 RepID=UPI0005EF7D65|nr:PREDICTED: uncharacterized protein LOC105451676 [Wasmannia auropunctata]
MCCRNATFIVLSLFLILFCDTTSSECNELVPCICSLPDGYYYNLTALADAEPLEAIVDDKVNWTIRFHPCTNVKMKLDSNDTTCANGNGVSLCMHNKNQTLTGTVEETKMKLSTAGNFPIFEIVHKDVKSTINIICSPIKEDKTRFILDSPISSESKQLILQSLFLEGFPPGKFRRIHTQDCRT